MVLAMVLIEAVLMLLLLMLIKILACDVLTHHHSITARANETGNNNHTHNTVVVKCGVPFTQQHGHLDDNRDKHGMALIMVF